MGRAWKSFEMHARKSLYCHKGTVKGNSGESSGDKEEKEKKEKEKRTVGKASIFLENT